jgi:hypothetical protein
MRIIKPSCENEMVYEFLKMEFDSNRFKKEIEIVLTDLNISSELITNGDVTNDHENALRVSILSKFRGYRNAEIFENFPADIEWVWTEFDEGDFPHIRYIEYSYWNEISNDTGSPLEAAKTILSGKTVYDVPNDGFLKGAQMLGEGHKFPPMIFLTDKSEKLYYILEGHVRMTAYSLMPHTFKNVSVLLGYCDSDELNKWYGEMPFE